MVGRYQFVCWSQQAPTTDGRISGIWSSTAGSLTLANVFLHQLPLRALSGVSETYHHRQWVGEQPPVVPVSLVLVYIPCMHASIFGPGRNSARGSQGCRISRTKAKNGVTIPSWPAYQPTSVSLLLHLLHTNLFPLGTAPPIFWHKFKRNAREVRIWRWRSSIWDLDSTELVSIL